MSRKPRIMDVKPGDSFIIKDPDIGANWEHCHEYNMCNDCPHADKGCPDPDIKVGDTITIESVHRSHIQSVGYSAKFIVNGETWSVATGRLIRRATYVPCNTAPGVV